MKKGRNKELIRLRDRELLRRYYQMTEIERKRFDDTVRILSQEVFFISETRVIEIIQKYYNKEDYEQTEEL